MRRLFALALAAMMLMTACAKTDEQKYAKAQKLLTEGKLDKAVTAFTEIESYMESNKYIVYIKAVQMAEEGQYEQAIQNLESLGNFEEKLVASEVASITEKMWRTPGSYVKMGHYEQDNNEENGKEEIEWQVLEVDESSNRVLLISRYVLDAKPYFDEDYAYRNRKSFDDIYIYEIHSKGGCVEWENCTLRRWLNKEFLATAFTDEEQDKIPRVFVQPHEGWNPDPNPESETFDKLFLLSLQEVHDYWRLERMGVPTQYAIEQGVWTLSSIGITSSSEYGQNADGEETCRWWLRTHNYNGKTYLAYNIAIDGDDSTWFVDSNYGVRPAMWVKLGS